MRDPDTGMAALCGNQTFNGVIVNDLPWSRTVVAVWQIGWSLDATRRPRPAVQPMALFLGSGDGKPIWQQNAIHLATLGAQPSPLKLQDTERRAARHGEKL